MRSRVIVKITPVLAVLTIASGGIGHASTPPAAAAASSQVSIAGGSACSPPRLRPVPVVLVHGTFGDSRLLLDRLAASMRRDGYCVFALDYGNRATGLIEASADELAAYVDHVLVATGAPKVSLVGHSQGGMMARYYLKFLGGAGKVDDLVGLSPSNHGTYNPLLLTPGLRYLCPACLQQQRGSAFLRGLNAGDETPGRVSYTNIVTRYDAVVLPYTSGYLTGANTTNIKLQSKCPFDLAGHLLIPADGPAIRLVLNALGRRGPASATYQPSCRP